MDNKINKTVGIMFGRFNPPHRGHLAAWKMASEDDYWYVGTNQNTQGKKDPLPYDQKMAAMKALMPEISNHVMPSQNLFTMATQVYKKHGENIKLAVYTDEDWLAKSLKQYNGVEGKHGYYKFAQIEHHGTPRLSSATQLRDAVRQGDREEFAQAAGVPQDFAVQGTTYFDLVSQYLTPYFENAQSDKYNEHIGEQLMDHINILRKLSGLPLMEGAPVTFQPGYQMSDTDRKLADIGRIIMSRAETEKDPELSNVMAELGGGLSGGEISSQADLIDFIKGIEPAQQSALSSVATDAIKAYNDGERALGIPPGSEPEGEPEDDSEDFEEGIESDEYNHMDQVTSLAEAILHRIRHNHPEIIGKILDNPDWQAILSDVAEDYVDFEEIGSSDISAMVDAYLSALGINQNSEITEMRKLAGLEETLNPLKRMARRGRKPTEIYFNDGQFEIWYDEKDSEYPASDDDPLGKRYLDKTRDPKRLIRYAKEAFGSRAKIPVVNFGKNNDPVYRAGVETLMNAGFDVSADGFDAKADVMENANTMKRFMLFGYDTHYPSGGSYDVIRNFDSIEQAIAWIQEYGDHDNYEVLDCDERKFVWNGNRNSVGDPQFDLSDVAEDTLTEIGDTPAGRRGLADYAGKAARHGRAEMTISKDFENDYYNSLGDVNALHPGTFANRRHEHDDPDAALDQATRRADGFKKESDWWKNKSNRRMTGVARAAQRLARDPRGLG